MRQLPATPAPADAEQAALTRGGQREVSRHVHHPETSFAPHACCAAWASSVSLPLLDAMIPAATALAKTAAAPKPRLGFFYFPHGAIMEKWTPATAGRDFELSPILEPLAPFRKQLTVVSNLGNKPGESRAVHALVPATWLSCVHPQEGLEPHMAATVDQIAAQHIGQDTP